ncbi:MAG: ABC-F family ATP-binding cassette domain-containing protein [Actinobacteria bacterium]|nr:ABC-F family ATP-binding cassette domain-containing protein [Actinomycetota bacterium]
MLLSAEHITRTIGARTLFADINLTLYPGDKVGLVGRNGVGKTTFMKIIGEPTKGKVPAGGMCVRHWGEVGYLPQDPRIEQNADLTKTVTDHVLSSMNLDAERDQLAELLAAMEADPTERAITRYTAAQERYADKGGYTAEDKARNFAVGIGLREERLKAPLTELSGGELRLAEIARILFGSPDALLLDEPTNHIDTDARLWLLDFMRNYRGGLIVISHDLELLDESITRVVHLDEGRTFEYKGTYSQYKLSREADETRRAKEDVTREAEIRRMKTLADKMRGQSAKRARAAKALDQRVDRLKQEAPSSIARRKEASYKFPDPPHSHRTVLMIEDLAKSYDDNDVFEGLNFTLDRQQRMCLIGFNGAGKSTLLRLIAKLTTPTAGSVDYGVGVSVGYYDQEHGELDADETVIENARKGLSGFSDPETRSLLAKFQLTGDTVYQNVMTLSGGEKTKLALAKLVAGKHNVLLLDEPTNNLDPASRDYVAEALDSWPGTVIVVSHDTEFIDALNPDFSLVLPEADFSHWQESDLEMVALA